MPLCLSCFAQIVVLTLKLCVCYCLACLWLLPAPRLFSFVSLPNDTLKKTDLTAPRRTMTPSPLSLLVNLQATSGPWDLAPFPTHTCLPHLNIKRHYVLLPVVQSRAFGFTSCTIHNNISWLNGTVWHSRGEPRLGETEYVPLETNCALMLSTLLSRD